MQLSIIPLKSKLNSTLLLSTSIALTSLPQPPASSSDCADSFIPASLSLYGGADSPPSSYQSLQKIGT